MSDNQGVKEETFIQTSRRGRDGQLGVERMLGKAWGGGPGQARRWLVDQVVPHLHADKLVVTTGE